MTRWILIIGHRGEGRKEKWVNMDNEVRRRGKERKKVSYVAQ